MEASRSDVLLKSQLVCFFKVLSTTGTGLLHTTNLIRSNRISALFYNSSDTYSIIEADNIANENLKVAPEVIKYISDENRKAYILSRFKSPAYVLEIYFEVNRWKPACCFVEVRGTLVNYINKM